MLDDKYPTFLCYIRAAVVILQQFGRFRLKTSHMNYPSRAACERLTFFPRRQHFVLITACTSQALETSLEPWRFFEIHPEKPRQTMTSSLNVFCVSLFSAIFFFSLSAHLDQYHYSLNEVTVKGVKLSHITHNPAIWNSNVSNTENEKSAWSRQLSKVAHVSNERRKCCLKRNTSFGLKCSRESSRRQTVNSQQRSLNPWSALDDGQVLLKPNCCCKAIYLAYRYYSNCSLLLKSY